MSMTCTTKISTASTPLSALTGPVLESSGYSTSTSEHPIPLQQRCILCRGWWACFKTGFRLLWGGRCGHHVVWGEGLVQGVVGVLELMLFKRWEQEEEVVEVPDGGDGVEDQCIACVCV